MMFHITDIFLVLMFRKYSIQVSELCGRRADVKILHFWKAGRQKIKSTCRLKTCAAEKFTALNINTTADSHFSSSDTPEGFC